MKIVHISDIHIRNLRYHDSYNKVFEELYKFLEEVKPDLVINTGDTAHTKVQISPEFVEMASRHFRRVSDFAPYHIILGNHDMNLVNLDRQDAITPIIDSIGSSSKHPITLYKKSGVYNLDVSGEAVSLYVFSCADEENYPSLKDVSYNSINIGLYHGAIASAVTDTNWELEDTDDDVSLFDGLDYVLLGDIHQHQFMDKEGRVAYAGSLIQQNFGEKPDKGCLLWSIKDKDVWDVEHIQLKGSKRFFTIELDEKFNIPDVEIEPNSRIRVLPSSQYTLSDQQQFERLVKKKFKTTDVIVVPQNNIGTQSANSVVLGEDLKISNLRDTIVQDKLISAFLKDRKLPDDVLSKVYELNKKFQILIEKDENTVVIRDVRWKIKSIGWSNMFNYGENNIIDFQKMRGITGIFAPNSSGKSSFIDMMLESLFDKTTIDVGKNIFLINDNKKIAKMITSFETEDDYYTIERTIEKIKYGKRKLEEEKEWGKTSTEFKLINEDGSEIEVLNGQSRPETEKNIRRHIGTYNDFVMTSLLSQGRETDIIKCKETDRKKILYKFMDLDVFEQKYKLAKEDGRKYFQRLKDFEDGNLEELYETENCSQNIFKTEFEELTATKRILELDRVALDKEIAEISKCYTNVTFADTTLNELNETTSLLEHTEIEEIKRIEKLELIKCDIEKSITSINKKLSSISLEDALNSVKLIEKLKSDRDITESKLSVKKTKVNEWKKDTKILGEVPCGNSFPSCKFLTNAFEKKDKLLDLQKEVIKLEKKIAKVAVLIDEEVLNKNRTVVIEHATLVKSLKDRMILLNDTSSKINYKNLAVKLIEEKLKKSKLDTKKWKDNEETIKLNNEIKLKIQKRKEDRVSLIKKTDMLNHQILFVTKEIGSKEAVVKHLSNEIDEMRDVRITCDAFEHYADAMGKYGIAYQILVEKLPLINDEINKILSAVADFNVFIEHDASENSIRLYLKYGDYSARRLELAGGAEKLLASIAIRSALLSITNLPKSNMFIIDEGFGSLDSKNLDNINKIFDFLRSTFDHVLIISHIDALKDMVDNNIEISKDGEGYSHIEVI